jgi:hypothetical protein
VHCRSLLFCVVGMLGCSRAATRAEGSGDTLQVGAVSAAVAPELGADSGQQQPTVMFRCEEGRVGAYVVTSPLDSIPSEDQMIRITLDSVPDC